MSSAEVGTKGSSASVFRVTSVPDSKCSARSELLVLPYTGATTKPPVLPE